MLRFSFLTLFLLATLALHAQKKREVQQWVDQHANTLTTVEAGNSFADMMALKPLLIDKKIVGMGEATHGTREFFQMKHRMLEFLVEECDYRIFAIEANYPECLAVNDYVVNGNGDAKTALGGIYFWTWNTEEILSMIEWMRQWNIENPEGQPLVFMGVDMQMTQGGATAVSTFLQQHLPDLYATHQVELTEMAEMSIYQTPDSVKKDWKTTAETIFDRLHERPGAWSKDISSQKLEQVRMHARICKQATMNLGSDLIKVGSVRDSCMAANTRYLLENVGDGKQKMMLWAHNGHVKRKTYGTSNFRTQGHHLSEMYGDDYYVIGFGFGSGGFCAMGQGAFSTWHTEPPKKNSYGSYFESTQADQFFMDLASAQEDPVMGSFLDKRHFHRQIGSVYYAEWDNMFYAPIKLPDYYDGFIFVKNTTSARNLRGEDRYFGSIQQKIKKKLPPSTPFRLTAQVKLSNPSPDCRAQLWTSAETETIWYMSGKKTKSDTLRNTDWQEIMITGTSPEKMTREFGAGLTLWGSGTAYLDNVKLEYEEDGEWKTLSLKNADFEQKASSASLKKWKLSSEVYEMGLSTTEKAEGKQALKISWVGPNFLSQR